MEKPQTTEEVIPQLEISNELAEIKPQQQQERIAEVKEEKSNNKYYIIGGGIIIAAIILKYYTPNKPVIKTEYIHNPAPKPVEQKEVPKVTSTRKF